MNNLIQLELYKINKKFQILIKLNKNILNKNDIVFNFLI